MSKRPSDIVEALRRAIRKAEKRGITRYRVAKETGLSQGQLSRFLHGEIVPKLDNAQRIAQAIGLRLVLADS